MINKKIEFDKEMMDFMSFFIDAAVNYKRCDLLLQFYALLGDGYEEQKRDCKAKRAEFENIVKVLYRLVKGV